MSNRCLYAGGHSITRVLLSSTTPVSRTLVIVSTEVTQQLPGLNFQSCWFGGHRDVSQFCSNQVITKVSGRVSLKGKISSEVRMVVLIAASDVIFSRLVFLKSPVIKKFDVGFKTVVFCKLRAGFYGASARTNKSETSPII